MNNTSARNSYLDFLKFVFALGIMGTHTMLAGFDSTLIPSGWQGVDFYFLVSGYFITRQAMQERALGTSHGVVRYFIKRITSFYPFYFVAWLYGFALLQVSAHQGPEKVMQNLWYSIFDVIPLQVVGLPSLCVTAVQWYVGATFLVSPLVYALLYWLGGTATKVLAPIISVFIFGTIYLQIGTLGAPGTYIGGFVFSGLLRALADMLLASTMYEIAGSLAGVSLTRLGNSVLHGGRILLLTITVFCCATQTEDYKGFVFVVVIFAYLSLLFAYPVQCPVFCNRLFGELGKISSLCFMVHVPTGIGINALLPAWGVTHRLVLYYVASLLMSYGLYYLTQALRTKLNPLKILTQPHREL